MNYLHAIINYFKASALIQHLKEISIPDAQIDISQVTVYDNPQNICNDC